MPCGDCSVPLAHFTMVGGGCSSAASSTEDEEDREINVDSSREEEEEDRGPGEMTRSAASGTNGSGGAALAFSIRRLLGQEECESGEEGGKCPVIRVPAQRAQQAQHHQPQPPQQHHQPPPPIQPHHFPWLVHPAIMHNPAAAAAAAFASQVVKERLSGSEGSGRLQLLSCPLRLYSRSLHRKIILQQPRLEFYVQPQELSKLKWGS
ncbi:hypothetical protein AAG570_009489 [Ranatra chinensis]|uniref:Uncharacterized protein n=1 Tax=Ranatra chinensis TaxID=642074 RepID=A0ABD0YP77_9HEMI